MDKETKAKQPERSRSGSLSSLARIARFGVGLAFWAMGAYGVYFFGVEWYAKARWESVSEEFSAKSVLLLPLFVGALGVYLALEPGPLGKALIESNKKALLLAVQVFAAAIIGRLLILALQGG